MVFPVQYLKGVNFTAIGLGNNGPDLDNELTRVEVSIRSIGNALQLIQREDGAIENGAIHPAALRADTIQLFSNFNPRGAWVSNTNYKKGDLVSVSLNTYITLADHTSSASFDTDLANGLTMPVSSPVTLSSVLGSIGGEYSELSAALLAVSGNLPAINTVNSNQSEINAAVALVPFLTTLNGVRSVDDKAALVSLGTPSDGTIIIDVSSKDGGRFRYVTSSVYPDTGSAYCGTFVSDGSASGGWERVGIESSAYWAAWFGVYISNADNFTVWQAFVDYVVAIGGKMRHAAGAYMTSAEIVINSAASSLLGLDRVTVQGMGVGITQFVITGSSGSAMKYIGDDTGGAGSHVYSSPVTDITFVGGSASARSETGLKIRGAAFVEISRLAFINLNLPMKLSGVLSSSVNDCTFEQCVSGVVADSDGSFSNENAMSYNDCRFIGISYRGFSSAITSSTVKFTGCNFESCGEFGNAQSFGVTMAFTGGGGRNGVFFDTCHFERNRGLSDVRLIATSGLISASFNNCAFIRSTATDYTTNNIELSGAVLLKTEGCSFKGAGDYVPDASQPCIKMSSSAEHVSINDIHSHDVDKPANKKMMSHDGLITGTDGGSFDASSYIAPNGWSIIRNSVGSYTIQNHNKGDTDYSVAVGLMTSTAGSVTLSQGLNNLTFLIKTLPTSGVPVPTPVDAKFSFKLTPFS